MKKFSAFIEESRIRVGQLPFSLESFTNFIQDAIINGDYEDSPYWIQIEECITKQFDKKTFKIFIGWCEGYIEIQRNKTIEEFYNDLSQIPLDRLNKTLGAGSNGVVIDMGHNKVLKLFYGSEIKKCDKPFIEWCAKNKSKVFPKVYKIGKNWCVLEKLELNTPKIQKLFDLIDNTSVNGKTIYNWVKEKDVDVNIFSKDQKWAYDWCKQCQKEMKDMHSTCIGWPGDLASKNVGERSNGDIIFFDI